MSVITKRPVQLRVDPDDVKRIDQLATQHNLSRTEYMTLTALGKLDRVGIEGRLQEHAERLEAIEQRLELIYGS